ncbi:MAG TPA: helix-turn-helix transcriptional regulator [Streptosporangiaceae bacterium]|jgi:transcriptional regulator with XRE-family HTH domain
MTDNGDRSRTPEGVFGKALKFYRERAGLSQTELAALSNYSNTVINKIEKGDRPPAEGFPERMDAIPQLDTRGELSRLWGWLKDSARHRAYPGWFDRWPDFEAMATMLRWYEPLILPGLLQTDQYARAVFRTRIGDTDEEIDDMVAARLERQAILDKDKPPTLWAVLDEGVLRRPVGGPHVMREQLNRLAEAARRPNIVIQVIPFSTGSHEGLRGGAFVLAEFSDHPAMGYQDTAVRGMIVDDPPDVSSLMFLWDTVKSVALPRAASLSLIEEVAKTCT